MRNHPAAEEASQCFGGSIQASYDFRSALIPKRDLSPQYDADGTQRGSAEMVCADALAPERSEGVSETGRPLGGVANNLTHDGEWVYEWDDLGRLSRVKRALSGVLAGAHFQSHAYKYDVPRSECDDTQAKRRQWVDASRPSPKPAPTRAACATCIGA